ncbi:MAG: hypothetical protein KGI79_01955 [Patescibacteria group bacterium]|nr:hypothetical protein [Patescibacteria group bacterium]MDE2116616.1 hypothetical protein [Patescibacteria group bacterium]
MSRFELKRTIRRELRDLNWKIDMKIVRGLPYRTEARRHRILRMQLDRMNRTGRGVWTRMSGALSSVASFVL